MPGFSLRSRAFFCARERGCSAVDQILEHRCPVVRSDHRVALTPLLDGFAKGRQRGFCLLHADGLRL